MDLHTGSFHRANLPQLRADLNRPDVLRLTLPGYATFHIGIETGIADAAALADAAAQADALTEGAD